MKQILGKKVLFVTAHPDDESYLAAGTMLKNPAAGGVSYVACATFGEKGKSHIKGKVTVRQLKTLRKKELQAASRFLKVSELLMPGFPDAELEKKSNQEAFFEKLLSFAAKHRPAVMIGFGNDGVSGHLDHIAAGKVAKAVAKKLKIPFLKFSAPPQLHESMEELKRRRKHGKYLKSLKRQPHDIEIRVDPVKKLKALRFHKSQLDGREPLGSFSAKTVKQILSREYFSF